MNEWQKAVVGSALAIMLGWMGWVSVQLISIDKHLSFLDGGSNDRERRISDIERRLNRIEEKR